jgi:CDP-diacylglycerol--glycerol-3-phosphate 3-phosphatidyltransferase
MESGVSTASGSFGPSALATPANAVTVFRLLATPIMVLLIAREGPSWSAVAAWCLLSWTDGVDGFLARRQGATRSGAFLDPLADKVVVLGALFALVAKGIVWWVPAVIIAVREVTMSVYRSVVGRRGVSIPARTTAKVKTLAQDVAIGLCLAPPLATHKVVLSTAIWVATALTVFTGGQYFLDGRRSARQGVADGPDIGARPVDGSSSAA